MDETPDIQLIITQAGRDALVNAESGDTEAIQVVEVGLTNQVFVPAPTLTALPGEFKRLDAVAGQSASGTVIHMTATDPSDQVYELRGLGLYLADGTLFGVYGQATPIFRKVSIAAFLLAFDISFSSDIETSFAFGDSSFLNPPATESTKGVAELATEAEAIAGNDDERIITAKKLKAVLQTFLGVLGADDETFGEVLAALLARTITGGGLVQGGGDLTQSRTLTVQAASPEAALAGLVNDKALTPASLALILLDIADRALSSVTITGGGLVQGGGNLTANRTLSLDAATAAEADDGELDNKALTPASIVNLLADVASRALKTVAITGAGLAKGGGTIAASRAITVTASTSADVKAGTSDATAVTPKALADAAVSLGPNANWLPGGRIEQWGTVTVGSGSSGSVTFPTAFPTKCNDVQICPLDDPDDGDENDENFWRGATTRFGFAISASGDRSSTSFSWRAIGE